MFNEHFEYIVFVESDHVNDILSKPHLKFLDSMSVVVCDPVRFIEIEPRFHILRLSFWVVLLSKSLYLFLKILY